MIRKGKKYSEEELQAETLEELMEAMGALDGKRIQKPAMAPESSMPAMNGAAPDPMGMGGDIDPRLAEILRKKKKPDPNYA